MKISVVAGTTSRASTPKFDGIVFADRRGRGYALLMLYIVSPFQSIIWSLIISFALYQTFFALSARLGGRQKLSAAIIIFVILQLARMPVERYASRAPRYA